MPSFCHLRTIRNRANNAFILGTTDMKKFTFVASLVALLAAGGTAHAFNTPVNIAAPVNNSTVANNFYSSFTVNCPPGQNAVKWYLDGSPVGTASFYDTAGIHFAYSLGSGTSHSLKVVTSCGGSDGVRFKVQ